MLLNILKTTFRNLWRKKAFFFLNIIGLSVGMAAGLAIFYYVAFELSFDNFHKNADRTYRFILERTAEGETQEVVNVPATYKHWLKEYGAVQTVARFYRIDYQNIALSTAEKDRSAFADWVFYADPDFDEVADFGFREGGIEKFSEPNTIILSSRIADQLFPSGNAVGKMVDTQSNVGNDSYQVVGVLNPLPKNTDYKFNVLISMATLPAKEGNGLLTDENNFNFRIYFTLNDNYSAEELEAGINDEYLPSSNPEVKWEAKLIPLQQMHFKPYAMASSGSYSTIYSLSVIAIFILIIAWVNYVNLSVTRAMERAREVGVRKVLGADKRQLSLQFMGEALILNLLAALIAFTIVQAGSPFLQELGNPMQISPKQMMPFVGISAGIILIGTLLSGLYPALVMSGYKSSEVIKSSFRSHQSNILLRKGLVVFQFAISILLIIGTVVLYQQTTYLKNKELGMQISDLLVLKSPPGSLNDKSFNNRAVAFRESLARYAFVEDVSAASSIPGESITWGTTQIHPPGESSEVLEMVQLIACDANYFDVLDIDVIAGRPYQEGDDTFNKGDIIINEKAAEQFGWESPEEAIGKVLTGGNMFGDLTVIGVVQNNHHLSPHVDYEPTLYVLSIWANYYLVELSTAGNDGLPGLRDRIEQMEELWKAQFSEAPFDYYFLDNAFDRQFRADVNFSRLLLLFSSLAIIIAILGMFGLSAYEVFQRKREIGIRRILGASVQSIILAMSGNYLGLILLSGLFAIPAAYIATRIYLGKFAFSIDPGFYIFLLPVLLVVVIAFLIIYLQVWKSASSNPVETLKSE